MKPMNAVSHHAQNRAEQRWGVSISIEEIERQLASGDAEIYERENAAILKIIVRAADAKIPIVYNQRRKVVLTVLPKEELYRIQREFGAGLSKKQREEFWANLNPSRRHELQRWKDYQGILDPEYNSAVARRARERMARVDSLPADVRAAVHEYGLEIVWEFWLHGVRSGNDIGILIEASRRVEHAGSPSLVSLYRHFGVRADGAVRHLATAARMESVPTAPHQNRFRFNVGPNRQKNAVLKTRGTP